MQLYNVGKGPQGQDEYFQDQEADQTFLECSIW
jgi:hypothetical protein